MEKFEELSDEEEDVMKDIEMEDNVRYLTPINRGKLFPLPNNNSKNQHSPPPNPYVTNPSLHLAFDISQSAQLTEKKLSPAFTLVHSSSPALPTPPPMTEPSTIPAFVRAKFPFTASANGDLSFAKGDIITILGVARDDKWWIGSLGSAGKVGFVPSNFCEEFVGGFWLCLP